MASASRLGHAATGVAPSSALSVSIGHTPVVELRRISPNPAIRLFAKLEWVNPTGSVKDRIAQAMISEALASGALREGQTLLEASCGNIGISLALVGTRLGWPLSLVTPEHTY